MPNRIKAVVQINLKYPYQPSIYMLFRLITVWGFRLIKAGTNSAISVVEIPQDKFNTIFGANPIVGEWGVPQGTETFIQSIKVVEIKKESLI